MEMVSDKGIQYFYNNEKRRYMLHIDEGENPVSINSLEATNSLTFALANLSRKYQDPYRRYQHGLPDE